MNKLLSPPLSYVAQPAWTVERLYSLYKTFEVAYNAWFTRVKRNGGQDDALSRQRMMEVFVANPTNDSDLNRLAVPLYKHPKISLNMTCLTILLMPMTRLANGYGSSKKRPKIGR